MAIYIYTIATGQLYSYIPQNVTIAAAQASGQLADSATLANNGLAAIDGLPPQDSTHQWNPATLTVVTVTAPVPAQPMPTYFFLMRFTPAEYAAIEASTDAQVLQFWDAIRRTNIVDMSDQSIKDNGQHMISLGLLTSARGNAILTTPYVKSSQTQ